MKIKDIKIGKINIPLKKPFKTALRTVNLAEELVIKVIADTGEIGFGSAPPTAVITGDIESSINGSIKSIIAPKIIGMPIDSLELIMKEIDSAIVKNSSAKAAVDMAVYDLFGKLYKMPLFKFFGGYRNSFETDITISVNSPDEMALDAACAVKEGYKFLKVKVGTDIKIDMERIKKIREAVGDNISIRVDANQGWKPKEAVRIIRKLEDSGYDIELVEQPVKAYDIDGLKYVTDNVETDILADEAVFGPLEAMKIVNMRAANLINIKLMKCGGFHNASKIINIAESYGVECMMGCMLESKIGISAAASFAAGKKGITKVDLDTVMLFSEDPVVGGVKCDNNIITVSNEPGLGITDVIGWRELN